jgi:hypothetical protein
MALVRGLMPVKVALKLSGLLIITWIPRRNRHVMVSHMFISICSLYLYNHESFTFLLLSFLKLYQIMASQDMEPLFSTSTYSTETFSLDSVVSKHQTLGRKITNNYQELPTAIGSRREAQRLIGDVQKLRIEYQEMKAKSLRNLQKLIDKVQWIDNKISEVDIHIGRLYHVVNKSGIEAPPLAVDRKKRTVVIEGREYYYYYYCYYY